MSQSLGFGVQCDMKGIRLELRGDHFGLGWASEQAWGRKNDQYYGSRFLANYAVG